MYLCTEPQRVLCYLSKNWTRERFFIKSCPSLIVKRTSRVCEACNRKGKFCIALLRNMRGQYLNFLINLLWVWSTWFLQRFSVVFYFNPSPSAAMNFGIFLMPSLILISSTDSSYVLMTQSSKLAALCYSKHMRYGSQYLFVRSRMWLNEGRGQSSNPGGDISDGCCL